MSNTLTNLSTKGVSHRLFYSTLGVLATGAFGTAAALTAWTLLFVIGASVTAAAAIGLARTMIYRHRQYAHRDNTVQRRMMRMAVATIGSSYLVSLLWITTPRLWVFWAFVLLVLFAVVNATGHAQRYADRNFVKPGQPSNPAQPGGLPAGMTPEQWMHATNPDNTSVYGQATFTPDGEVDYTVPNFRQVLRRCNLKWLIVNPMYETIREPNGRVIGVRFRARVPANMMRADGKAVLNEAHSEPIAAAISEKAEEAGRPTDIEPSWVSVSKQRGAGLYKITIVEEDIFGRVFPWVDDPRPRSITEPVLKGYDITLNPVYGPLLQHGSYIGQSTSGKSSSVHNDLAQTTLCTDEVDWLCGVKKFYDLVGPWLRPYRGKDEEVPFDWICTGPEDSTRMLAAALWLSRWRQSQEPEIRRQFKKVIVWLDEAHYLFTNDNAVALYDKMLLDASPIVDDGTRGTASSGIFFRLVSQRSTNDNWGTHGGSISANLRDNAVFKTNDKAELWRAFDNSKLPMPTRPGVMWYDPDTGDPLVQIKAPYQQTDDTSQPMLLPGGPFITDVAWARQTIIKGGLDKPSAEALGAWYANRRRTADEILPYVQLGVSDTEDPNEPWNYNIPRKRGGNVVVQNNFAATPTATATATRTDDVPDLDGTGLNWDNLTHRQRNVAKSVYDEIAKIDEQLGLDPAAEQPAIEEANPGNLIPLFGSEPPKKPKTRGERILEIISSSTTPLRRAEIEARLLERYNDQVTDSQVITNELRRLRKATKILYSEEHEGYVKA